MEGVFQKVSVRKLSQTQISNKAINHWSLQHPSSETLLLFLKKHPPQDPPSHHAWIFKPQKLDLKKNWRKYDDSRTHREVAPRDKGVQRQPAVSQTVTQKLLYGNQNAKEKEEPCKEFQQRVDRHGNDPFGERTSTKQTRNAPPEREADVQELTWRKYEPRAFSHKQLSPQYSRDRVTNQRPSAKSRDLFPSQNKGQWKPKLVRTPEEFQPKYASPDIEQPKGTALALRTPEEGTSNDIPTREAVMEVLQEATRKYLSHPDLVEAAARRQRVHFGDANGEMEEAASVMLAAAEERNELASQRNLGENDPVTPPPLQLHPQEAWMLPDPSVVRSPSVNCDLEVDLEDDLREGLELERENSPARSVIRSIIVSPTNGKKAVEEAQQVSPEATKDSETLLNFQKRTRRGTQRSPQLRSPRTTPNILRGASLKKRKLSQILSSPGAGGRQSVNSTTSKAKKSKAAETSRSRKHQISEKNKQVAGPPQASSNPPISLWAKESPKGIWVVNSFENGSRSPPCE
ncbi:hypothetical protein Bca101_017465 [Brassica carinata]